MPMYHAPTPKDDDSHAGEGPEAIEPTLIDAGNDKLRDAHLHNGQVEARARFAPYFAISAVAAAGLCAWAMFGSVGTELIVGWLGLVLFVNWVACRRVMAAAAIGSSRTAKPQNRTVAVAEAMGLALIWASLPTYAFATQPPDVQFVIGGSIGGMIVASLSLAAVPAAAIAWISTLTVAFCVGYGFGAERLDFKLGTTFVLLAAIGIFGVTRLTQWLFSLLKSIAKTRAAYESIRLLLKEYEHRGVGWLWQVDAENRVVYISSRMTGLIGRSPAQVVGHSLPATLGGTGALGRTLLAREAFANLVMELNTRRGTRWISLSGDPVIDVTGQFQGFRGVGSDITEVRKTQERLTNLANMDVLSGLPNRGKVRQLLGEALESSAKTNVPCAIMFLDLDGFKPVNDTFGHPKGDAVLKSVSQRLVHEVGSLGEVGRMGGDEFAVVINDAQSRRTVEELARRIIASIAEPYFIDKAEIRIGVSVGCAFGPIDGKSVDDLIQKADLALYQAKAQGRGICCFFNVDMASEQEDRLRVEQDLKTALATNQFRLMFQPLINASDQSLIGFEALIRWQHPTRGVVSPLEFIPVAEESGLICDLGDWVIEEACRAAAVWPANITVAVNVSAKQLVFPALPNTVNEALARHRLQANRLELEVTESIFLGENAHTLDVLKRLRAIGVGIALDDFGTGYSSLGYLNKAVFHKLKIDGSFVREAADNREAVAIIQSIVQLAKSFRMTVTAEGVETADDFTRMRDLGVHQIQGYLFGRPMSFERATELVHGLQQRMSA
jgi:diguanylate cyclase (GGDEF)-like protein